MLIALPVGGAAALEAKQELMARFRALNSNWTEDACGVQEEEFTAGKAAEGMWWDACHSQPFSKTGRHTESAASRRALCGNGWMCSPSVRAVQGVRQDRQKGPTGPSPLNLPLCAAASPC